jgi:hypothetical protein
MGTQVTVHFHLLIALFAPPMAIYTGFGVPFIGD